MFCVVTYLLRALTVEFPGAGGRNWFYPAALNARFSKALIYLCAALSMDVINGYVYFRRPRLSISFSAKTLKSADASLAITRLR